MQELDLYKEELELEQSMIQYGKERYLNNTKKAEENSRGSETSYAKRLLTSLCEDTASTIEAYCLSGLGVGKRTYAKTVLRKLEFEQSAYITLKSIFDSLIREESLIGIAINIGQRIEDQIRFTEFQTSHPDLYQYITKEFKEHNVVNYRRKHRVLTHAHSNQYEWKGLTPNQRVQLGTVLIEQAIKATGMFDLKLKYSKGKSSKVLYATQDTLDWIEEHIARFALLFPDFAPTVLKPKPWTAMKEGGYYLKPLSRRCPFIKTHSRVQRAGIKDHDYSFTMKAVNKVQETPWRINQFVLDAMQEVYRRNLRVGMPPSNPYDIPACPYTKDLNKKDMNGLQLGIFNLWKKEVSDIYTLEKTRVSKCMLLGRVMSSAVKYSKYERFYFVYNCDFRGRIYATSSGFSPQGPDISKGILEFSEGKALGEDGFKWLCIHGANVYGFDKAEFKDRVKWCLDRKEQLISIGLNAFSAGAVDIWKEADKPYQFLAFCQEFAGAVKDPQGFISHLPIALDGSCNGLQHFSAILRDEVGGRAVNLLPSSKPQDIYSDVADVCTVRLKQMQGTEYDPDNHAYKALHFGVDRKICKKPVMTLPYGSTLNNCMRKTTEYVIENKERSIWGDDVYKGCIFLGKVIWVSIDDVVIAARSAMTWLKAASNKVSSYNEPIKWLTPTNFLMYQSTMVFKSKQIKTQLLGNCQLYLNEETPVLDKRKQCSGISPNFIHSLDASHLCMTVNATDFSAYAMIHDSFGTHACNTDVLARVLREQFYKLYNDNDVLQDLKDQLESQCNVELDDIPEKGSLDISEVLNSEYFFG
jgi:DNA-directed RNA polymerase